MAGTLFVSARAVSATTARSNRTETPPASATKPSGCRRTIRTGSAVGAKAGGAAEGLLGNGNGVRTVVPGGGAIAGTGGTANGLRTDGVSGGKSRNKEDSSSVDSARPSEARPEPVPPGFAVPTAPGMAPGMAREESALFRINLTPFSPGSKRKIGGGALATVADIGAGEVEGVPVQEIRVSNARRRGGMNGTPREPTLTAAVARGSQIVNKASSAESRSAER